MPTTASIPACILLFCLINLGGTSAHARQVVRIDTVYGSQTPRVGELVNYRVRIREGATMPVEYYWDFSDGARAEGMTASRRYTRAGRLRVVVQARNKYGRDADTLLVTVRPAAATADLLSEEATPRDSLPKSAPTAAPVRSVPSTALSNSHATSADDGYTWVLASFLHREAAESAMRQYRSDGFETTLLVDVSGTGSPAYRLVMGHFSTVEAALRARDHLPPARPGPPLLVALRDLKSNAPGSAPRHTP